MNTSTLCITTQRRLDRHEPGGYCFRLSEYSNMAELYAAFGRCFRDEQAPQFRFVEWSDIPDELVREDWLSPNLCEALEALAEIDDDDRDRFICWCRQNGYDIATDDVAELAARYLSIYAGYSVPEENPPDEEDSPYIMELMSGIYNYMSDTFDDDYN